MYADNFPPLTFADLSKAIQRESWGGLGQVDSSPNYLCPDGTNAPQNNPLNCLSTETTPGGGGFQPIFNQMAANAESPYYLTVGGMQISMSTLIIGGLVLLIGVGAMLGGRR